MHYTQLFTQHSSYPIPFALFNFKNCVEVSLLNKKTLIDLTSFSFMYLDLNKFLLHEKLFSFIVCSNF